VADKRRKWVHLNNAYCWTFDLWLWFSCSVLSAYTLPISFAWMNESERVLLRIIKGQLLERCIWALLSSSSFSCTYRVGWQRTSAAAFVMANVLAPAQPYVRDVDQLKFHVIEKWGIDKAVVTSFSRLRYFLRRWNVTFWVLTSRVFCYFHAGANWTMCLEIFSNLGRY